MFFAFCLECDISAGEPHDEPDESADEPDDDGASSDCYLPKLPMALSFVSYSWWFGIVRAVAFDCVRSISMQGFVKASISSWCCPECFLKASCAVIMLVFLKHDNDPRVFFLCFKRYLQGSLIRESNGWRHPFLCLRDARLSLLVFSLIWKVQVCFFSLGCFVSCSITCS